MSKLLCVAVFDSAVQAYNRPFFVPARGLAVRSFTDEVNRKAPDNVMNAHPGDFDLVLLGTWDEGEGEFVNELTRTVLARGVDVHVKE